MTRGTGSPTDNLVLSGDPRYAGLPDTPPPVICEFCGAERYTEGIFILGHVMWYPNGVRHCTCPEGLAKHNREQADYEAKKEAERVAEEERKQRERVRRVIGNSGMGERFLQRTFGTFITNTPDRKRIKASAQDYAENFTQQLPKRGEPLPGRNGFIITGTKGTGKTHIAAAIANSLLNRGTAVICMTERDLLDRIRRTYSRYEQDDESAVLEVYKTVPLLIVDDIGKERPTEWTLATIYSVIDGRYERAMPTIVTTNYGATDLVKRLTPMSGDETTADATVDRLIEMCEGIVMSGESWRSR